VVVFTRDLRVHDHPALSAACNGAAAVVPMFVLDEAILHDAAANRVGFLVDSLRDLDDSLRQRGAGLVVRRGSWVDEVMAVVTQAQASSIHISDDVSALARLRLERLRDVAARARVSVETHPGITVVPPAVLRPTSGGESYQVFTPYLRRWLEASWRPVLPAPRRIPSRESFQFPGMEPVDSLASTGRSPKLIAGGEAIARRRLTAFIRDELEDYDDRRDDLAGDTTSRISAALHFGCLSPLETATRVRPLAGGEAFVRQLCWRDFFHQVLAARPETAQRDLRGGGRRWNDDDRAFESWCAARTGFPVVDAAMRQLTDEGFMHNRARMIVASFLTKDLYIDWRLGAAHFMSLLVDGDVANNQLNWQWVAGTGTDTNPNRVFNPVVQGRRFDSSGAYIRRHLPELADLDAREIHWPDMATRGRLGYPAPIVDHREAIDEYRLRLQSDSG